MRKKYISIKKFHKVNQHIVPFSGRISRFKKTKWNLIKKSVSRGSRIYSPQTNLRKRRLHPAHFYYKNRLNAKQMLRGTFGFIKDKQLKNIVLNSGTDKDEILKQLNTRLDILLYQLGFGESLFKIRQYISHGCFEINSNKVLNKSTNVRLNDIISVNKKYRKFFFKEISHRLSHDNSFFFPPYVELNLANLTGVLIDYPNSKNTKYYNPVDLVSLTLHYTRG